MKTKHTPGPWTIEKDYELLYVSPKANLNEIICEIGSVTEPVTPLSQANARLIAAAPDMYKLLHQLWAQTDPTDKTSRIIAQILDRIDNGGSNE